MKIDYIESISNKKIEINLEIVEIVLIFCNFLDFFLISINPKNVKYYQKCIRILESRLDKDSSGRVHNIDDSSTHQSCFHPLKPYTTYEIALQSSTANVHNNFLCTYPEKIAKTFTRENPDSTFKTSLKRTYSEIIQRCNCRLQPFIMSS